METRVAVISIIVENPEMVQTLNGLLHEYSEFIIGRMGIPYPKRNVSIITVALDAPPEHHLHSLREIGRPVRCQCQNRLFQCHWKE